MRGKDRGERVGGEREERGKREGVPLVRKSRTNKNNLNAQTTRFI